MSGAPNPQPLVSLCVGAFNSVPFLHDCLKSLTGQDYPSLEILIADDHSSDASWDVIQSYAAKDLRIKPVRQDRNLGWIGNVNWLLEHARGDFVSIIGHDDMIAPDYVSRLMSALLAQPEAVMACADLLEFGDCPPMRAVYRSAKGPRWFRALAFFFAPYSWVAYRGLLRRQVLKETGGLRTGPRGAAASADIVWIFRVALAGAIIRVPHLLYFKRRLKTSLSASWNLETWRKHLPWRWTYWRMLWAACSDVPGGRGIEWMLRITLIAYLVPCLLLWLPLSKLAQMRSRLRPSSKSELTLGRESPLANCLTFTRGSA